MKETVPSICRNCLAFCPVLVTLENGRPVKVTGDPQAQDYEGYYCPKGSALPEQMADSVRLLHSVKRRLDGGFAPIAASEAVAEIAAKVKALVERHGPRSVALYFGNGSIQHPFGAGMAVAVLRALGSPMWFNSVTIDKPAEAVSMAMHGYWMAGAQSFASSDALVIVGANPVVAKSNGAPVNNPGMRMKEALRRGMSLIVLDPRRTETARRARFHLQLKPGEDSVVLAGMIHILMRDDLCDRSFVAENAVGFEQLKAAAASFTPSYVAARAGIAEEELVAATHAFGRAKRGGVVCSTGPSFATRGNLTFYLGLCINTLCGRWGRTGDTAAYPNVLLPAFTPKAQPISPVSVYGANAMRIHGLRESASGNPTAVLADEMLLEGEGQVKALFNLGGNPMSSWPDQRKTEAALSRLELLVSLDPFMSATASCSHYVIAPKMPLEVPGCTFIPEILKYSGVSRGAQGSWAQYVPVTCLPPPGSDLMEEHEFFFRLGQALGLQLDWVSYFGLWKFQESPPERFPLDMSAVPTVDELFARTLHNARIPLEEVKKYPHGHRFDLDVKIAPRDADCQDKLDIGNGMMMDELAQVRAEDFTTGCGDSEFPYLLVCRRLNAFYNSVGQDLATLNRGKRHNPAFMHPADLEALGIVSGDIVSIRSRHGEILGIAEADGTMRRGVVAMTHGFGARGAEAERDPRLAGSNVNMLTSVAEHDPITGLPRMSALPIAVRPFQTAGDAVLR